MTVVLAPVPLPALSASNVLARLRRRRWRPLAQRKEEGCLLLLLCGGRERLPMEEEEEEMVSREQRKRGGRRRKSGRNEATMKRRRWEKPLFTTAREIPLRILCVPSLVPLSPLSLSLSLSLAAHLRGEYGWQVISFCRGEGERELFYSTILCSLFKELVDDGGLAILGTATSRHSSMWRFTTTVQWTSAIRILQCSRELLVVRIISY